MTVRYKDGLAGRVEETGDWMAALSEFVVNINCRRRWFYYNIVAVVLNAIHHIVRNVKP